MDQENDVVVIGGGQAGLAMGYYLRKLSINFRILDDQEESGGAWLHTWDSLTLFSPADASSLPGWPMPPSEGEYPNRGEVIDYLKQYEKRYQLPVNRPVKVRTVNKTNDSKFQVVTDKHTYECRAVVNATGTWRNPYIPGYPGVDSFKGQQIHSAHYKRPSPFKGKTVIIIGGGNSAAQILSEVSSYGNTIWVTKTEPKFLPDDVDGRYLFREASQMYEKQKFGKSQYETVFDLGSIVMVPAVKDARDRGVLVSNKPFQRFYEDGIIWQDGSYRQADAVIWCTGFKPALRHLRKLPVFESNGHVAITNNESKFVKNLWFVGYGNWTGFASATLIGVGRNAKYVAGQIQKRLKPQLQKKG